MIIVWMFDGNGLSALRAGSNRIDRFSFPVSGSVMKHSTGAYSSSLWIVMQHG